MSKIQIDSASGGTRTSEEACAQPIKKRGTLRMSATRRSDRLSPSTYRAYSAEAT